MADKKLKDQLLADWFEKLKESGKSREEIERLLKGVASLAALDVYTAVMLALTEEDLAAIEKETDDKKAEELAEELFEKRSGMTVGELVERAQSAMVGGGFSGGES